MRVMLLGAGGMLGSNLTATVPVDVTLFPFQHAALDITNRTALRSATADVRPHVILNAAAYTAVDQAESEPDRVFRVNGEAVSELGRTAKAGGIGVVHFSSDYVFDGTATAPYPEEAAPNPINVYGASKLAGERGLRDSGAEVLVIRSQWLFGSGGRSFPGTMLERARLGLPSRVVQDQFGSPTYAWDLAQATWRLLAQRATGTVHVANEGTASWFDVALAVYEAVGRPDLCTACTSLEYPTPARRPAYSCLRTDLCRLLLGDPLPPWRDALGRFLDEVTAPAPPPAPPSRG
jgi:dTDP-4-dehydrorhamnose reductase